MCIRMAHQSLSHLLILEEDSSYEVILIRMPMGQDYDFGSHGPRIILPINRRAQKALALRKGLRGLITNLIHAGLRIEGQISIDRLYCSAANAYQL